MREHKIVVLGPMGAGKTTAIKSIVEGAIVSTDVKNTEVNASKETTTVGLDYGDVNLPNGDRLRIFGTPGQARFDFLWGALAKGAVGALILISAECDDPAHEIAQYLQALKEVAGDLPIVLGISKADLVTAQQLEQCKAALSAHGFALPLVVCDVREKANVLMLMDVLMCEIETQALLAAF